MARNLIPETEPASAVQVEARYALTPMQQALLFQSLYEREPGADVVQVVCRFGAGLEVEAFDEGWRRLFERHAALRTRFDWDDSEEPLQEVLSGVQLTPERHDWRGMSPQERASRFDDYLQEDRRRGFDLARAPLMRLALFAFADEEHQFVWTFHHALLDRRSASIILEELLAFYDASRRGDDPSLPPARPFRDYVEWLRRQDDSAAQDFWRASLSGFNAPTPLPAARTTSEDASHEHAEPYAERELRLSRQTEAALRSFAQAQGVTLQTVALGVWSLLLGRYSGESEVVFGVNLATLPPSLDGSERIIGLLINTLPARVRLPPRVPVLVWLRELQAEQHLLREYGHTPLHSIRRWSEVAAGASLFESLVILDEPSSPGDATTGSGVAAEGFEAQFLERTNYPLTLTVLTRPQLRLRLAYDRRRFDDEAISRMLGQLETLLSAIATTGEQALSRLPLLGEYERRQILAAWNDTARDYPRDLCLHQLLERRAEQTPDRIAVSFEGDGLTYAELNARANQLAHRLRALGVGTETRVGLLLERSTDTFAALFGILKTGAAYVPLDPTHPAERLAFMLADSQAAVLLTQQSLAASLAPGATPRVIHLERRWETTAGESRENLPPHASGENLAYVIYTSGSTGQPKGVQITHGSVVNLLHSMKERPGMTGDDILLAITTFSFDMAVPDLYLPLLVGARVELVSRESAFDGRRLLEKLRSSGATILQATPSTWRMLLEAGWEGDRRLKALCGAEAMPRDLADHLLARCGSVWNLYGPTETTVWSTIDEVEEQKGSVSIGRPLDNTEIYLLDAHLQPVPIGAPGELHIGGAGVARGYLNRPELTAERFIPHPFSRQPGARLYRTGDAARYLPDGRIEYINRLDNQVKVRGFRIELGEIEARLRQHERVREAVVVVRDDRAGGKTLVGYIVPLQAKPVSASELREFLRGGLPEYMIPSFFVSLDALPLTPNGKINRRGLPAPDEQSAGTERGFVPPRDALEVQLAQIWERVLGIERVGIGDNFFELGGHSLMAVRLFIRIEKELGRNLPLATLIHAPTVEALANLLREDGSTPRWSPLVPLQPRGTRPPFFCVHGVGGNILNYHGLASRLGQEQPFYGLQSQGLNGEQPPLTRIEEMAALYLKEIMRLQPAGPYYLGGASFGGLVAFEMARQLHAEGESAALVALFDTTPFGYSTLLPPTASATQNEGLAHKLQVHLGVLLRGPDRLTYLRKRVRRVRRRAIYRSWQVIYRIFQSVGRPLPAVLRNVQQANYKALRDYRPGVYAGRVTLFYATNEPEEFTRDKLHGWGVLATGGVAAHGVPGDHLTMIEEPHVGALAEKLKACLDESRVSPA